MSETIDFVVTRFGSTCPMAEAEGVSGIVLVCPEVRGGAPVLHVCRNGEGLHLLCGKAHESELWAFSPEPQVMIHVRLAELLAEDPSLADVATMNERHTVSRVTRGGPWVPNDDQSYWWF